MYTVEIGRAFLKLYNEKTGADLNAKEFFDRVMYPIFFDTEDDRHLISINNSELWQPSYARLALEQGKTVPSYRRERMQIKIDQIVEGTLRISNGQAPGFGEGGLESFTSGQITDLNWKVDENTVFTAWIGVAFGIKVDGDYHVLINNPFILWHLFSGWKYYRLFLDQTPNLLAKDINGWNGIWLLRGKPSSNDPSEYWDSISAELGNDLKLSANQNYSIQAPSWVHLVFKLCQTLYVANSSDSVQRVIAQGYEISKRNNRTIGTLVIYLDQVDSIRDMWNRVLRINQAEVGFETSEAIDQYLKPRYSLERAAQLGSIGVPAFEPDKLRKFIGTGECPKFDKDDKFTYYVYLTWLMVMISNDETLNLAERLALELKKYADWQPPNEKVGKTERPNKVAKLWESKSKNYFIDQLNELVNERNPPAPEVLNEAVDASMLHIPADRFALFVTLVKFKYNYHNVNSK